jgi:hypothetical protein
MNNKFEKEKTWHQALTTPQSVRIRKIHAVLGKNLLGEFEHFEAEFLKQLYLDVAIARYETIARAFAVWKSVYPGANIRDQRWVLNQMIQKRSCQN